MSFTIKRKSLHHPFSVFHLARVSTYVITVMAAATCLTSSAYGISLTMARHLFDIEHSFKQPSDVAVAPNGHIYVVDGVNNAIKIFDRSGTFIKAFGTRGSREGNLLFPLGIDIGSDGTVYVADTGNRRVQIFNEAGIFQKKLDLPPESDPTDVAVDASGNRLYVVDNDNHRILVYELSTLRFLTSFGKPGAEKRAFRYPFLMTLDRDGYLYIVDVINTRVQVLNPEGLFVTFVGGWGVEKGEFFRPKGVAVDEKNHVFVSDSHLGVIQVFGPHGEFLSALGDPASGGVRKFKTPTGIAIHGERLFVVEMFAEKVSVYALEELTDDDRPTRAGE